MLKENLTGLVVCGGRSTRMETDKSKIIYHGEQQRYFIYKMLQRLCAEVYISCNEEQAQYMSTEYEFIVDAGEFTGIGPAAALLSAEKKYPGRNWLVVACDYPFVKPESLAHFIRTIKDHTAAATFYSPAKKVYEPLLGFYAAHAAEQRSIILKGENYSLQQYLKIINAVKYVADKEEIKNINTPDEMRIAKQLIKNSSDEEGK